ncbi:RluA family pseudouridine synthase [Salipiger bermudensis]|uniref:RluA family pseudouridine synthase n=1 Tax=Salipiger bermudensis TaxID=344736 RepID=UPI001C993BB6|nr:RluA family pseudouridine synthase [Salipiger bermudensis]MBY6002576.1 RluA family pseudouridine synthase [Salipiger bermudensis]
MSDVYSPPQGEIPILHEDSDLLVVDKPAGLLSVPGKGPELADCLIARLERAFPTVRLVHRLDRDTSGVMVFALTAHAQRHLGQQFETRKTRKTYIARVAGRLEPKTGSVDLPLIVDWPNRPLQKVCFDTGKPALTEYKVTKSDDSESRVRLHPLTGRSHQLRVHMLALGHPIIGDPLYAPETAAQYPRMMLHAEELRLHHPESGIGVKFRAKAPF